MLLNSLVLYKNRPARIVQLGDKKIEIEVLELGRMKVRPKDVLLLHKGPLPSLSALNDVPEGDVEIAWELMSGSMTTLAELAELSYEEFTPQTAWAIWQLVMDGLYFVGESPDAIRVQMATAVAQEQDARDTKVAEAQEWDDFLVRVEKGELAENDGRYLQEVVALANKQREKSKLLSALGQSETPEQAHSLLLRLGYWDEMVNPYPLRTGLTMASAEAILPDLPDEERRDLTHLPAFAIDDEGNQDPDDALSYSDGRYWVHIADVAALIQPDSPADLEARARGANLYLPEGTVTMLPHAATAQLGLGLAEISPALSFGFTLSETGEVGELDVTPSWVKVTRLTYADADMRLDEPVLREWAAASQIYETRRRQNGSVEIDLPEVRIRVVDGRVVIRPLPRLRSRDLVRDAMLMTGEAVAQFAFANNIPIPYTVQDPPRETPPPASTLSEMFARRKLMSPSQQTSQPGAHAGLGMGMYVQATSPLRRYLDMIVHQQLRAYVSGGTLFDEQELMARVGAANAVSGDVRWAERQSNRHWTWVYLLQNQEWTGEGVVIDQRGKQDFVLIPELDLETRIYRKGQRPLDTTIRLKFLEADLANGDGRFQEIIDSE